MIISCFKVDCIVKKLLRILLKVSKSIWKETTSKVVLLQVHTGHNNNTLENTLAPGYCIWYPGALFL